jgi:urease accessory protein
MRKIRYYKGAIAGLGLSATAAVQAHTTACGWNGDALLTGLSHPFLGWDHVVAAVAVGLWGAWQKGLPAWSLPVVFLGMGTVGGVAAHSGLTPPLAEAGIASSLLLIGLLLAFAARPPRVASVSLVALFATFVGYAHGTEIQADAPAIAYGSGMAVSTAGLLALGFGLGRLAWGHLSAKLLRWSAGAIATAGILSWM